MSHPSEASIMRAHGERYAELSIFPLRIDVATIRSLWAVLKAWRGGRRLQVRPRFRFEYRCLKKWR